MGNIWKTRALAGAAYRGLNSGLYALTHLVSTRTDEVVCRRVNPDSVLDDDFATDPWARPTCPRCAKRWDKLVLDAKPGT